MSFELNSKNNSYQLVIRSLDWFSGTENEMS